VLNGDSADLATLLRRDRGRCADGEASRRAAELPEDARHDAVEERGVRLAFEDHDLEAFDAAREHGARALVDLVALAVGEEEVALHRADEVELAVVLGVVGIDDLDPRADDRRAGSGIVCARAWSGWTPWGRVRGRRSVGSSAEGR
jgi:hypothetical protein